MMLCTCGQCRLCWLVVNDPRYAAKFSGNPTVGNGSVKRIKPCKDLGEKVSPGCQCADRTCLAGLGSVRHLVECQTCERYELPQL